jgi:SulP family sulfate permease
VGFFCGIAGCAMIAQTVVNVKIGGGRTRLSTMAAALVLLVLMTVLSGLMAQIPLVALAAVMMVAALKTFNWHSVTPATLKRMPLSETSVLATTVIITVASGNLAFGVIGGVLLAMVLFARRVAHVVCVERMLSEDGAAVRYAVHGSLFFGNSNDLVERFAYTMDPQEITVDLTYSQIWDASSVAALDSLETKYRNLGRAITFTGLDPRSLAFHARLTGQLQS